MARQATIIVNYCNVSGTVTTIFPDASENKCLPNGSNYEVTAALQTLTVNVLCPISAITGDLQNTFTSSQITFTIPQNDSNYRRTFTEVVTFADGTTATIYIAQKGYSVKNVRVPISEHYMCYQGNKYYANRQMISYDGVNYIWKEPPVYYNSWVVYSSGDTDCYDGECEWNDLGETYCLSGTLYSVQQKVCDGAYTEEKRLNQVIGECEDPAEGYEYRWALSTGLTICGENTSGGTGPTPDTGDTPSVVTDKWIEDGYACSGYNKYISETHVYSNDGITFFPEYPPETRLGALVEQNSEYCGYELKTQWRDDGDEGCYGTTLRHVLVKYVSDDMGVTWTKADPEETQPGDIIRTGATECGWIEWDELKYYGIYDGDYEDAYTVEDDGTTTITTADTKPVGRDITHLTKAVVGSGVTTIGSACFSNASSLTDVTIHNVTVVEASAFADCVSLETFNTNAVQTIGQNAFRGCTGLKSVTFAGSVTSIAPYAFYDCTGLQALYFNSATPPTLGQNALANTNNCPIYVYYANLSTYQAAWPDLATRLVGRIPPPSSDDTM